VKIFLGVAASDDVRSRAGALSRQLQMRASATAPHARLSWVPPDRFHLTVLFIGHVSAAQAGAVRLALESPFSEPPFDLTMVGAGVFPASGRPRVVWAGCGDGQPAFVRIQREAYARLGGVLPLEPEPDPQPHLTLARVKEPAGLRARSLLAETEGVRLGMIRVDAVTLFESRQGGGSLQYVPLMKTALEAE
jgi:RNA 2',3'-cyclic 3'-phosphodiesterase